MKRVHIVGLSPRTGTTLMMELMASCFKFEAYADHEMPLSYVPNETVSTFCSKRPQDFDVAMKLRNIQNLWIICLTRDPRDVVVSKHQKAPDAYWVDLCIFKRRAALLSSSSPESNKFIMVKYEELVSHPDRIQEHLMEAIPFLVKKANFSDFHKVAKPGQESIKALGGLRQISTSSIGNWRNHLPRLKAQIEQYGDISAMLIELGYEKDTGWMKALEGINANNGVSCKNRKSFASGFKEKFKTQRRYWRICLGRQKKKEVIINKAYRSEHGYQVDNQKAQ